MHRRSEQGFGLKLEASWEAERHLIAFSRDFIWVALKAPVKILDQLLIHCKQEKAAK